jgi:hypothetical protein
MLAGALRRLRRVVGMPCARALVRRSEEVVVVDCAKSLAPEPEGDVRLRQIGTAALGEVVVVVKSVPLRGEEVVGAAVAVRPQIGRLFSCYDRRH